MSVKLPNDCNVKLEHLRQRRNERRAMLDSVYASIRDCEARCTRFANLVRAAGTPEARAEYAAKLEADRAEHERLVARRIRLDAELRSAATDFARVEDWQLRLSVSTRLRVLPKRATTFDADKLAAVRADIAKLQEELQHNESRPLDRKSQQAIWRQEFDNVLAGFFIEDAPYRKKTCTRSASMRELTMLEYDWWRHPDQRDELLDRLVPEVPNGITAATKAAAREQIGARLLSLERVEEGLIEAAEAARTAIERRADASVLAILGVALVKVSEPEANAA